MTGATDSRSRPRRRGRALEDTIIQAAMDELEEVGYAGLTMEAVARRAGAGKASLYRRWPSRIELAIEVAYRLSEDPALPPEPSSLRDDLRVTMHAVANQFTGPIGEVMRGAIAESLAAPQSARVADLARGKGSDLLRTIVARARARGEEVHDPTRVQLMIPTALMHYHLVTRQEPDSSLVDSVIDDVLIPMLKG